jgi:hypothetical protein
MSCYEQIRCGRREQIEEKMEGGITEKYQSLDNCDAIILP